MTLRWPTFLTPSGQNTQPTTSPTPPPPPPPISSPTTQPRRSQRLRDKTKPPDITNTQPPTADPISVTYDSPTPDQQSSQNSGSKIKTKSKKKILWYNPPFSASLKTKFGKLFLQLLDKHFPITHPLYSVMNRKKCKISFRICPSMKSVITNHNNRILQNHHPQEETPPCNCRGACPIPNKQCRTKSVIYSAKIKDATYIGLTSGPIKDRITCHRQTFREKNRQNSTTLSKFIWINKLNCDSNGEMIEPPVQWSVLKQSHTYKPGQKHCNLCLSEKLLILQNINKPHNINKRTDLASICIHKQKHFLASVA